MTLEAAAKFDFEQLAEVFNAGYEGYFVPVRVDAAGLASMVDLWDTDLRQFEYELHRFGASSRSSVTRG